MSIGQRILEEIIKQGMVSVVHPEIPAETPVVFCWAANTGEQLEALVAEHAQNQHKETAKALEFATKPVSLIEDFLWGRKYCTELYISPLGFNGGEEWQVELNYGDGTQAAFSGKSVAEAFGKAFVGAMTRNAGREGNTNDISL